MSLIDRLERRWGWIAFPGFLRYYALFHVLVFVLQLIRPDIGEILEFDRAKIMAGEVWRVGTMFFAISEFGKPNLIGIIFLFFAVNFVFMVSDGLEGAWGSFKASLFYYTGILLILGASFLYKSTVPTSGMMLYASAFLAFATLFPKVEIRLFMIIPVQVRFLGMLVAGGLLLNLLAAPLLAPFFVLAFANYLIWVAVPVLKGRALILESAQRRQKFKSSVQPAKEAFHTCEKCQKTELTDPYLEFRIGTDGNEYCTDHIPE